MLLQFEGDFEALVISHRFVKVVIYHSIGNVNFSSKDLIQVTSQFVSGTPRVKSMLKVMVL